MATILPFVVRPRATKSASERQGTIIIFPGVRYEKTRASTERRDHDRPATVGGGSRKGRRKAR
jgi:hypothetical protein